MSARPTITGITPDAECVRIAANRRQLRSARGGPGARWTRSARVAPRAPLPFAPPPPPPRASTRGGARPPPSPSFRPWGPRRRGPAAPAPTPSSSTASPPPSSSSATGAAAEEAQRRDFRRGEDGVYRERQGDLLYVTVNRAKPHRCNDRVEDVIQALFEGNPFLAVPPTWRLARACFASKPGEEPEDPYVFLDLPAPVRERREEGGGAAGRGTRGKRRSGWFGGG